MSAFSRLMASAALGAAVLAAGLPAAMAETPPNMLVIANRIDDITSLDPAESFEFSGADVIRNMYLKLVNLDPMDMSAGYQPEIAESWDVSEDGRTVTFNIRSGLSFASGNPVTADDVVYSLRRAVLLNKTPSFILTQFGFTAENVEETITGADGTVSITTDKPYAISFVLNCLTATIGAIVDSKLVMEHEADGDMGNTWLKTNSAGGGAYTLAAWQPNENVTLNANPGFYKGEPAMKRVIVRHVQESASQRLMLERGDIDVARNLNPEDIAGISGEEGIRIDEELGGQLMYLSFNQDNPELAKPEVREAMKYLIDYAGMADSFLKGQWAVQQNFLPLTFLGAVDENPFSLDIEKAKALLAEAGVPEGFTIEAGVREAQERIEIAQSFQNALAQVGIKLDITVGTAAQILGRYRARDLDVYVGTWGPDYPDPHTNASTFAWNPDNSVEAGATGILAWRNAWDPGALTAQVDAAVIENDTEKRVEMYHEIQAEFRDTSPFAILFQQARQTAVRDNVENLNLGDAISSAAYWPVTK
ncbi:ABC transporter substrate-binding protein [Poseidonocella sp. HB161398]|uniref:ABC transporter substrate-binding protein n=1 Tax=Poseidonocella sp. HB161398 TaxID=2320855 RepID=UPI00110946DD|nr:ABC transporter substrate-binding protein [Poseidonocella sp. HB161398]